MNKIIEIRSLLAHLFSAKRRQKAKLLIKEQLVGNPLISIKNDHTGLTLQPDPVADTWRNEESRAIDAAYFKLGTAPLVEDRVTKNGQVLTEHEYKVHQVYGATSYGNEASHRSIFNRTGERMEQLSFTKPGTRAPSKQRQSVSRTVQGVTANLYGTIGSAEGNYFHWFVDTLPRLFIIERFHALDSIDQVLVPPLKYDFQWDSLAAFGFDRSRIIELKPLQCVQFECLLASSPPRGKGSAVVPGWSIERYRKTLLEKAANTPSVAGKKVFISRRDAPKRMFLNEHEVCDFLERRGFDIVELTPLNLWQKIAVFRDADLIVSQTGAGLTNIMFCDGKIKVLELVDKNFVYPLYASLAVYSGGTHHAQFFSNDSLLGRINAFVAKSSLNTEELEESLSGIE